MVEKFERSWELLKISFSILMENKKLLIFPIVSFICTAGIFLFFASAFIFQPTGHNYTEKAHWEALGQKVFTNESIQNLEQQEGTHQGKKKLALNETGMLAIAVIYFLAMFLGTFFNVAFYHEIIGALNGDPVHLSEGFQFAMSKIRPILLWSLFAGAIGYIIRMLEERMGLFGKIFLSIIGMTFSIASIFAIPVLICDPKASNPIDVLKASANAIKKTWGEALIGYVGLSLIPFFILTLFPVVAIIMIASSLNLPMVAPIAIISWIGFSILFSYIAGIAGTIFRCALFLYATTGTVPSIYNEDLMISAWKYKNE